MDLAFLGTERRILCELLSRNHAPQPEPRPAWALRVRAQGVHSSEGFTGMSFLHGLGLSNLWPRAFGFRSVWFQVEASS